MHRTFIAIGFAALVCGHATAGPAFPCQRIEYAQLKDSTKKELSEEYCDANRKAALNKDLAAIRRGAGLDRNQQAERWPRKFRHPDKWKLCFITAGHEPEKAARPWYASGRGILS